MSESARELVQALAQVAFIHNPATRAEKRRLVSALAARPLRTAAALREYHELLCFLQAYPDDPELLARVDDELARFHLRTPAVRARLHDSGIAHTVLEY